ncbi:MAG: hypothetical protein U0172_07235 [Nitrospiraceae bacterium]
MPLRFHRGRALTKHSVRPFALVATFLILTPAFAAGPDRLAPHTPNATTPGYSQLTVAPPAPPADLGGAVSILVTFRSKDNFTNEYLYDVTVRNIGVDPLVGDSLHLILDRITNIGGDDREPLKNESLLSRMEILGTAGQTADGKPYFSLTPSSGTDLLPQTDCLPVTVRLKNRDYVQVFTPVFRVVGSRRPPPPARAGDGVVSIGSTSTAGTSGQKGAPRVEDPHSLAQSHQMDALIHLLIKKGVISEDDWRNALQDRPQDIGGTRR